MPYYRCNVNASSVGNVPKEYTMTISGSASRSSNPIDIGVQPNARVSGVFPWNILSMIYDTCTVTCSANQSPSGNPSVSGVGTYYKEDTNNDINVSASINGINTNRSWSFNATFTARFYNR